jgi:hypothetical protein
MKNQVKLLNPIELEFIEWILHEATKKQLKEFLELIKQEMKK